MRRPLSGKVPINNKARTGHTPDRRTEGGDGLRRWVRNAGRGVLALMLCAGAVLPWAACALSRAPDKKAAEPAMGGVDGPCVALTFDDGPRSATTPLLLDGLARRGVHATFFVVGTNVDGCEELLQRMAGEGHQIGVHSQNHKMLTGLSAAELDEEVTDLRRTLTALLGERELMLRPPYGMVDNALLRRVEMPVILWSIDPMDWSDRNTAREVAEIVSQIRDGDIILLHDIYAASVEAALQVVDALMARGFYFLTVEELFAVRAVTPQAGHVYRRLPPEGG